VVEPTCNDDVPGDVPAAANFDVFNNPPVCVGGDVDLPAASGDKVVGPTCIDDDPGDVPVFDDPPFCVGGDQVDLPAAFEYVLENPFSDNDLSDLLNVCVGGDHVDLPAASGDKVVELTCNDDDPEAANSNVFDDSPVCVGGDQVDLPATSDDRLVEPTCNDDDPVDVPAEAAAANSDVFDDPVCVSGDQVSLRLFVCLLLNGTSALFRPLMPRIVEIEHTNHVKNDLKEKSYFKFCLFVCCLTAHQHYLGH